MIVHPHSHGGGVVLLDAGEKLTVAILPHTDGSARGFDVTASREFGDIIRTVAVSADSDMLPEFKKPSRLTRILVQNRAGARKRVLIFEEVEEPSKLKMKGKSI